MLSLYKGPILNTTHVFFFWEVISLKTVRTLTGQFFIFIGLLFHWQLFFKVKNLLLSHGYPPQKNIGSD